MQLQDGPSPWSCRPTLGGIVADPRRAGQFFPVNLFRPPVRHVQKLWILVEFRRGMTVATFGRHGVAPAERPPKGAKS